MYTGLGIAPAIPIAIEVGQKISSLLGGHMTANLQRITGLIATNYSAALAGDRSALQWLYDKSGAADTGNINFNTYTGKGWTPKDIGGSSLMVMFQYAMGLRSATYDYYVDAAQKLGEEVLASPNKLNTVVKLNNIDTPLRTGSAPTKLLTVAAPAPAPQVKQAGLLGMDLSSPTVLASLGFVVLALILREK